MKELGKGKEETFVNYVLCESYKNVAFETRVFMKCIFFYFFFLNRDNFCSATRKVFLK
jgi:hypothetical protein